MALHCLPKYLSQFVSAYCSIFFNNNRLEFSDLCYIIFQQKQAWILRSMLYKPSCQKEARDVFIGCTMWSLDRCSNAMTYGTAVGLKIIGLKRLVRTKFWLLWERANFIRSDQCNSVAFCLFVSFYNAGAQPATSTDVHSPLSWAPSSLVSADRLCLQCH